MATLSSDLIWEITRGNSATLVKRAQSGGVQFSRDPLNLTNSYSRKYEGSVESKAVGVQPSEKGVTIYTKNPDKANQPSAHVKETPTEHGSAFKAVDKATANYRSDLYPDAVKRAYQIRKSEKKPKEDKPAKLRGAKARKAAA